MKPQSAKAKGRRLQQMVMNGLLGIFPHLSADDIRSTSMGAGGEDILLSPAARRVLPYTFEAKNQERVSIWTAIEQARKNNPCAHTPVVVFKKNGEQPHVALPWSHFLQMLAAVGGSPVAHAPVDGDTTAGVAHPPPVPAPAPTRKERLIHIADILHQLACEDADPAEAGA